MATVIELNDNNFEAEAIDSDRPVLVDFFAEWCGHCKQQAPVMEEIASAHSDRVTVGLFNIDGNDKVPASFGVMSIPKLILFKGGKAVWEEVGFTSKEKIEKALDENL